MISKSSVKKTFRPVSPAQHAALLHYTSDFYVFDDYDDILQIDAQGDFDNFYDIALQLLSGGYRGEPGGPCPPPLPAHVR